MVVVMVIPIITTMSTALTGFFYSCNGQADALAKALYCSHLLNCVTLNP